MNPDDLLTIAEKLVPGGVAGAPGHPSDTELRRAISCTYYALFHALCRCCADQVVGQNPTGLLAEQKWEQVYRALDHGPAKRRCNNNQEMGKFPPEVQRFAEMFVDLQQQRHEADYNPKDGIWADIADTVLDVCTPGRKVNKIRFGTTTRN